MFVNHRVFAKRLQIFNPSGVRIPRFFGLKRFPYSRLTGENEERTHRVLSASLDLFSETIRIHNGKVVHYAGDAILAEFTTVTEALSCAIEVQRELHTPAHSPTPPDSMGSDQDPEMLLGLPPLRFLFR